MPGIKEAKGFLYSLLIIGTLVLLASLYSTVWAAPSPEVSGQTTTLPTETPTHTPTATNTPTNTPTPTRTPTPTPTVTPVPTVTPTPTAVPTITPRPTVVPPSTETNVVVPVQSGTTATGAVVETNGKQTLVTTEQQVNVGGDVGNVKASIDTDLLNIPSGASLSVTVSKEPDATASAAFTLAATDAGTTIKSIAFTVNVTRTNLANGTDLGEARITMKVSSAWVEAQGGVGSVRIFRYAEDGTRQVLETRVLGVIDGEYVFEGISPDGLSVFALIALDAAPPVAVPSGGAIKAFAPDASTTLTSPDGKVTVSIPGSAPKGVGWLMYTPKTATSVPAAPPAGQAFGSAIFDLTGIDASGAGAATTSFHTPITISVKYSDADIQAAQGNPARLVLAKYDSVFKVWTPLVTTFDVAAKTVQTQVGSVSSFALLGQPLPPTPTPTATATPRPGQATATPTVTPTATAKPTATLLPPTPGDVAPGSGLLMGLLVAALVLMAAGGYYLRESRQS